MFNSKRKRIKKIEERLQAIEKELTFLEKAIDDNLRSIHRLAFEVYPEERQKQPFDLIR